MIRTLTRSVRPLTKYRVYCTFAWRPVIMSTEMIKSSDNGVLFLFLERNWVFIGSKVTTRGSMMVLLLIIMQSRNYNLSTCKNLVSLIILVSVRIGMLCNHLCGNSPVFGGTTDITSWVWRLFINWYVVTVAGDQYHRFVFKAEVGGESPCSCAAILLLLVLPVSPARCIL